MRTKKHKILSTVVLNMAKYTINEQISEYICQKFVNNISEYEDIHAKIFEYPNFRWSLQDCYLKQSLYNPKDRLKYVKYKFWNTPIICFRSEDFSEPEQLEEENSCTVLMWKTL